MSTPDLTSTKQDTHPSDELSGTGSNLREASGPTAETGVDALDIALLLAEKKKFIFKFALLFTILGVLYSYVTPSVFTATAKILAPQQTQSNAVAILTQIGAVGGGGGGVGRNVNDVYLAMLKSRPVAYEIIQKFKLQGETGGKSLEDVRNGLASASKIQSGRDGVVSIEVDDADPKRAAAIANAYIEGLENLTRSLAVTEAAQRRLFFEKELVASNAALAEAEVGVKDFKLESGLFSPDNQAGMAISTSANLRAQITSKELQAAALRLSVTEKHPDYLRVQNEITALKSEMARLEDDANRGKGDLTISIKKGPEASLAFVRATRDLRYREAVYDLVKRQYEAAKLDEAKNATLIQVLEKAIEPERRSFPKRRVIVTTAALIGFFLAIALVILSHFLRPWALTHKNAARIDEIRQHFYSDETRRVLNQRWPGKGAG